MADLTSKTVKQPPSDLPDISAAPEDSVTIQMLQDQGSRRKGRMYVVDGALAHHFVEVMKIATVVKDEPAAVADRAVAGPPRAPKK